MRKVLALFLFIMFAGVSFAQLAGDSVINPITGELDKVSSDESIQAATGWTHTGTVVKLTTSTDNVGIGSTLPQTMLDVAGTVTAIKFVGDGSGITGIAAAGGWTKSGALVFTTTSTDNVGIGSTNPRASLDVAGAGYFNNVYSSGNVGVGSSVPQQKLEVAGTIQTTGFKLTTSPTLNYVLTSDANGVGSWAAASGASGWTSTSGQVVTTTSTDNVGVGSSVPGFKLDVAGTVNASALYINGSSPGYITNSYYSAGTGIGIGTTGVITNTAPDQTVSIGTTGTGIAISGTYPNFTLTGSSSGSQWLTNGASIGTTGAVGIGSTAPRSMLDVVGTVYATSLFTTGNVGLGSTAPLARLETIGVGTTSATNNLSLRNSAGTSLLVVNDSGNVGIGITNPSSGVGVAKVLQIQDLASAGLRLRENTGGGSVEIYATGNGSFFDVYGDSTGSQNILQFRTEETNSTATPTARLTILSDGNIGIGTTGPLGLLDVNRKLTVLSGGNVGIGTTSPSQKLDVVGTVNATAFSGDGASITGLPWTKSSANVYTTTTSDNVGIGTSTYINKLSVFGNAAIGSGYPSTAAPANGLIVQGNVGIGTSAAANGLTIQGTTYAIGNVGINTSTLTNNLQVAGTAYIGGNKTFSATGGTITTSGGNTIHTFNNVGVGTFTPNGDGTVTYLVVAGGGGAAGQRGAAGGAGGFRTGTLSVSGATAVTVGDGGAGGNGLVQGDNGQDSVFGSITSTGGGGAGANAAVGRNGGSGGGGAASSARAGGDSDYLTPKQGYDGGSGIDSASPAAGGGGGSGAVGGNASNAQGGAGGTGTNSSITGSVVMYACGGGAGAYSGAGGAAGCSSAGAGSVAVTGTGAAGSANSGSGGGGMGDGAAVTGGKGGSGVVIVSYPTPDTIGLQVSSTSKVGVGTITPSNSFSVVGTADFNGNVGIGTTAPQQKLDVVGTVKAAGFIASTGNVGISTTAPCTRFEDGLCTGS